jgi:signal transduction histidine kinase
MINLIEQDTSSVISFEVNKPNIIHEKLTMSADLLLLGGSELDVATLYREMEVEVQQSKNQSIQLSNELAKQEIKLTKQKSKLTTLSNQLAHTRGSLDKLNKELVENTKVAQAQKIELAQLQQSLINNHQQLTKERLELQQVTKQYQRTGNKLRTQESILEDKTKKNQEIMSVVEQNKMVLEQQENELNLQNVQLKAQETDLFSKKKTIHDQQTYLILTSSLAIVAFLAILLIVFFFNKSQKTTKKLALTLTNLNDTQARLIQSEKFASLGRLTAGVAHEINTPLSVAITANSLVSEDTLHVKNKIESASLSKARMVEHIAKAEESSTMIDNSLNRVKNLLDNFKLVAADQENEDQREINLADYINEVISTLSSEMKKNNTTYQCTGDTNILITTLPGVFYQVLTNLIMNSITHGFDNAHKGEISIVISPLGKDRVEISYQDNGQGMDEYTLNNIFEPFFTTTRGQGSTGLGMNIVFNLVHQQLKGDISVETEQNVGTFIKLLLPISL